MMEIMEAIAALDTDVITIESSCSVMEILNAVEKFAYPNDIALVFMILIHRIFFVWLKWKILLCVYYASVSIYSYGTTLD